jgi:hypothetical protein
MSASITLHSNTILLDTQCVAVRPRYTTAYHLYTAASPAAHVGQHVSKDAAFTSLYTLAQLQATDLPCPTKAYAAPPAAHVRQHQVVCPRTVPELQLMALTGVTAVQVAVALGQEPAAHVRSGTMQ